MQSEFCRLVSKIAIVVRALREQRGKSEAKEKKSE
jgi:hypothetical protein